MLRLILKKDGKWLPVDMPSEERLTAEMISTWEGKPCRIHYNDGVRDYYAYGDEAVKWKDEDCKVTMTIPHFANFWCYELLRHGIDTFSKIELRDEREAIMLAEKETPEIIRQVIEQYPLIYGANNAQDCKTI